jgi:hypothetical protein
MHWQNSVSWRRLFIGAGNRDLTGAHYDGIKRERALGMGEKSIRRRRAPKNERRPQAPFYFQDIKACALPGS